MRDTTRKRTSRFGPQETRKRAPGNRRAGACGGKAADRRSTSLTAQSLPKGSGGAPTQAGIGKTGRAKIYDIDFARDALRPESKKVLEEIDMVMHDHPDWKLRVAGHTDNRGGDAPDLVPSNRRAAALKQALMERYHVESGRLSAAGLGASRPMATNDTLEGRALNRRVELVRESAGPAPEMSWLLDGALPAGAKASRGLRPRERSYGA